MFNQLSPLLQKVANLIMVIVFVIAVVISKVLVFIFIFEIDYSCFLLPILPSGAFLGLVFLIALVNWIDQKE
jgi:Na+-translocating ferredoxin:NAD+ oxidoreductase RnfE subunit